MESVISQYYEVPFLHNHYNGKVSEGFFRDSSLFKALKVMISKKHPELSGNDEHSLTWIEITNEIHEGY